VALDFPVGTDFPGGVIPDGHIHEGFYWDAATGVWKRLCDRDKIGDCLDDGTSETVCDRLEFLQNEIIELEEEIDAIATSVGRGTYEWDFNVSNYLEPLQAGKFYMVKVDVNGGVLGVTQDYSEAGKFIFHQTDLDGNLHTFDDQLIDDILMMFDRPDPDFFEGTVTAVAEGANPNSTKYYIIDVTHASSQGSPTNNPDGEGNYKARLNIFEAPTGGGAGEFVKKIGDTMSGDLAIDRSTGTADVAAALTLKGERSDTNDSAATVKFENANNSPNPGYLTYKSYGNSSWFGFDQDVDLTNHGLHSVAHIRMQAGGYIGSGSSGRITVRDGSNSSAGTEIKRPGDGKRTFAIRGRVAGSGSVDDFFYAYGNSGTGGDAVNYTGKISTGTNIVNKAYVDSKAGGKVDITCTPSGKTVGDMWYCNNDQTLYIKVS